MEPFAPQSWEMPPGARVLEESASVVAREFDGERLNWKVALVQVPSFTEPVFWMRLCDARDDAGFIVYEATYVYEAPFSPELNLKALNWVFEKANYQRQFILNAQGELRQEGEEAYEGLLVDSIGGGSWSLGAIRPEPHDKSGFTWDSMMTPAQFRRLPALEVWRRVQEAMVNANSDGAFARRFALMNEIERHALIYKDTSISKQEFESALRAFVIAQDLWEQESYDEEILFALFSDGAIYLGIGDEESPIPTQLEASVEALRQSYLPVNEEVEHFSCVKDWLDNRAELAELVISPPTAHEQLEAALRWRQWKENHEKI